MVSNEIAQRAEVRHDRLSTVRPTNIVPPAVCTVGPSLRARRDCHRSAV